MSTIGNALNKWLQRYGTSVMRQAPATICDAIPPATKGRMVDISIRSANKYKEMGAPITSDYTLGTVFTGTRESVPVPRPEGTIGTYHTHVAPPRPFPGISDTLETMKYDDKVMCIGTTGLGPRTKVQCFTPNKPEWSDIQFRFRLLVDDINDYNKKVSAKFKPRGTGLRKLLEVVGSPTYPRDMGIATPGRLEEESAKAERAAKSAVEAIKLADTRIGETARAVEIAQTELSKATTKDEIRESTIIVRAKEEEARRARAKAMIERELAIDARAAADRVVFSIKALAAGKAYVDTVSKEANECLREGADLMRRRRSLEGEIEKQLRELSTPEEWKTLKWTDGLTEVPFFEAHPNMFNKCRIIWETFVEELPMEE